MQRPIQRSLTISPPIDKLSPQRPQTRTPANRQPPPQLLLHFAHLLHQLSAALARVLALGNRVHRTGQEETDGFVNMCFGRDGREGEFGERLGDADDGFELADRDGDRAACVGGGFRRCDAAPDRDEV